MLSDSLYDAMEEIWGAVENYDYSEDYKEELVCALTKLGFIMYRLDRLKVDVVWSEEDYKNAVLKRWEELRTDSRA